MDAVSVINGSVFPCMKNWDCFRIVSRTDMRRFWKRENWQLMRLGPQRIMRCVDYEYAMEECRNGLQVLIQGRQCGQSGSYYTNGIVKIIQILQDSAFVQMINTLKRYRERDILITM